MRVDFYLLEETAPDALWLTACRLLEKAYSKQHQVFVYCANQQDAEHLDELLWTFKPESFIPHHLQGEGPEPPPPIQIGHNSEPRGFQDILMNLSPTIPAFATRFARIIEIVSADEAAKAISREHFKAYRQQGFAPQTHQMPQKAQ
jgi:DNA polymerase-3 subunit chi